MALDAIDGVPAEALQRLTEHGIVGAADLCGRGADGPGRAALADATGLTESFVEDLVNRADAHLARAAGSVSVVIATRDRPVLLRRAIEAVMAQDHPGAIEVVVVFDRSEVDTALATVDGDRSIVVTTNQHPPGLAGARNSGVDRATGAWIAFCDDDDEWLPGKLAGQFAALAEEPRAVVATSGIFVHFDGTDTARIPEQRELTFEGFLRDRMTAVHPSTVLVTRRAFTERIGPVDEEIPGSYAEDYDWLLRASRRSPIAVAPAPLVRINWHGASFFFERWQTIDAALTYLIAKFPEFATVPKGLARLRGQQAVARAAMGHRRQALSSIVATLRLNPLERRAPAALLVVLGVPAGAILKLLHRFGKGI